MENVWLSLRLFFPNTFIDFNLEWYFSNSHSGTYACGDAGNRCTARVAGAGHICSNCHLYPHTVPHPRIPQDRKDFECAHTDILPGWAGNRCWGSSRQTGAYANSCAACSMGETGASVHKSSFIPPLAVKWNRPVITMPPARDRFRRLMKM